MDGGLAPFTGEMLYIAVLNANVCFLYVNVVQPLRLMLFLNHMIKYTLKIHENYCI